MKEGEEGDWENYLNEKRKSERVPKPGLPKKHTNEGTRTKKKDLIKFKSTKYYNEHYIYKTKEWLELHDKLYHSQQGITRTERKKLELYLGKKSTDFGTDKEKTQYK